MIDPPRASNTQENGGSMRAVLTRPGQMIVSELDDPKPGPGHVLVRPLACGICGSDLHAADDLRHFAELTSRSGGPFSLDPESGIVLGHEFCAEVVDYGPETQREIPAGATVCSVPIIFGPAGPEGIGYSNRFVGGLSELMLLQEALILRVPEGLAPEQAALTEPLAVGEHAVATAGVSGDVCMVIGCGPVGLAVIAALKVRGHGPVIAADFSPIRRQLAELIGADEVVDPAAQSPYGGWAELGVPATVRDRAALELVGGQVKDAVIFEAVGVPGVLQSIIDGAPARARVVVAGVCMRTDHIEPFFAVTKELELRFSFGYTRAEFATTLDRLGRGELAVKSMVTDIVELDGVAAAFDALRTPNAHGKVLVQP